MQLGAHRPQSGPLRSCRLLCGNSVCRRRLVPRLRPPSTRGDHFRDGDRRAAKGDFFREHARPPERCRRPSTAAPPRGHWAAASAALDACRSSGRQRYLHPSSRPSLASDHRLRLRARARAWRRTRAILRPADGDSAARVLPQPPPAPCSQSRSACVAAAPSAERAIDSPPITASSAPSPGP